MSAVNAEPNAYWCACIVVSVGNAAHLALRDVPCDAPRFWYAIAIGADAALAGADRTIAINDDEGGLDALLPRLVDAWTSIEFVYVVFDQHDDDARRLGCAILEAARCPDRTVVAVLLGRTFACHREPVRDLCDAVLRLSDERSPTSVADALYAILSAFICLWAPIPLDELAMRLREASDAHVVVRRCSRRSMGTDIASLIDGTVDRPYFLHLLHASEALTIRAASHALPLDRLANTYLSAGTGDTLVSDQILSAIVAPLGARMIARAGRQLRSIVADRASDLPSRTRSNARYRRRLQEELAWWTARDDRADHLLDFASVVANVERKGGVVGPALRNAGGSLVAYVLGLGAFDPVGWDLSFEEFVNGRESFALKASISQATFNLHSPPVNGQTALVVDPRLNIFDVAGARSPDWRTALRVLEILLARRCGEMTNVDPALRASSDVTCPSRGVLLYEDQVTSVLMHLLKANYPRADRLRRSLAEGGASGEWAAAECLKWLHLKLDRATALATIEAIRGSATSSTSRSVALSNALVQLATSRH